MPAKKRTLASEVEDLQRRLEGLDGEIDLVRKMRRYDKPEQKRINDGVTSAHKRSADLEDSVEVLETRVGILEGASNAVIKSVTEFVGLFQTRVSNLNADSARHEERISRLETSSNNRGSIFATWLAVFCTIVVGMLIAHSYLAERFTTFYQGRTIDIGAHPGYDPIFWAAGIIAVLATTVAAIVAASSGSNSSRSSIKTSSSSKSSATSSTDSSAVAEDYVYVETTPTMIAPVVRV